MLDLFPETEQPVEIIPARKLSARAAVLYVAPFDDFQTFSARRRICGAVSASGMSSGKVSSAEMDLVGRSGMTGLWSMPRASS